MYLKITFADHPDSLVEVTAGHTFQILGTDGAVQAAFAFDGVSDITLHAEQLAPQPVSAPVEAPPLEAPAADTPPADTPAADVPPADVPPADTPPADPTLDTAVADAQAAVETATAVAADPSVTVPEVVDHLAKATADVEAALATFPDSAELQDAKAQLDALAAQVTPAV